MAIVYVRSGDGYIVGLRERALCVVHTKTSEFVPAHKTPIGRDVPDEVVEKHLPQSEWQFHFYHGFFTPAMLKELLDLLPKAEPDNGRGAVVAPETPQAPATAPLEIWHGTARLDDNWLILHTGEDESYRLETAPENIYENDWFNGITQLTVVGVQLPVKESVIRVSTLHPTTQTVAAPPVPPDPRVPLTVQQERESARQNAPPPPFVLSPEDEAKRRSMLEKHERVITTVPEEARIRAEIEAREGNTPPVQPNLYPMIGE